MGEQRLNFLCHARGEYANHECTSECGIYRGIFIAKHSQPHERLVSRRVVGKPSLIRLRTDCPSLVHNARVMAEGANSIDGRLIYVFPSLVLLSAVEISSTGLP